jgi:hypothetical protein
MIKKADRDTILAMLEDPMVRYKEILVRLVSALPCEAGTEVPAEVEKPVGPNYPAHEERAWNEAWEKKCRRERGVAPEPDFAAMAEEIWRKRWAHGPADNGKASFVVACVDVLRANAHRFAAPAPAVVRDEAWWMSVVRRVEDAGTWESGADILRSTFAAESAFDVEAFAKRCREQMGNYPTITELIRAVAREMGLGKGGA